MSGELDGKFNRRNFLKAAATGALGIVALEATGAGAAEIYPGYGEDAKTLQKKENEREAAEKEGKKEDAERLGTEVRDLMSNMTEKMRAAVEKLGLKK